MRPGMELVTNLRENLSKFIILLAMVVSLQFASSKAPIDTKSCLRKSHISFAIEDVAICSKIIPSMILYSSSLEKLNSKYRHLESHSYLTIFVIN